MVQSTILPHLQYNESPHTAAGDEAIIQSVTQSITQSIPQTTNRAISIHGIECLVIYGRKNTQTPEGITGIQSIYLINHTNVNRPSIKARIGILETDKTHKPHHVFFSFVTADYLRPYSARSASSTSAATAAPTLFGSGTAELKKRADPADLNAFKEIKEKEIKEIKTKTAHRNFNHNVPTATPAISLSTGVLTAPRTDAIYTMIPGFICPPELIEETEQTAAVLRDEFIPSVTHSWIATFMQNAHYRTKENEGGGDCFFASVRDAFREIGRHTTVDILRNIVAAEMPEASFTVQKQMHADMVNEQNVLVNEMKQFHVQAEKLTHYIQEQRRIAANAGQELNPAIKNQYNKTVETLRSKFGQTKRDLETVSRHLAQSDSLAMARIQTMEQYRNHIRTSNYWADEVSVLILEYFCQIKFVIFSELNYRQNFMDGVLVCTPDPAEGRGTFRPKYYILLSYSGNHYTQILYKGRGIMTRQELPYDVKTLIRDKCAESRAHGFAVIPEWAAEQAFYQGSKQSGKQKSASGGGGGGGGGCNSGINGGEKEVQTGIQSKELFLYVCEDVNFVYSIHSADVYPGKGAGESILTSAQPLFRALSKHTHWRRMLSDEYPCVIKIDSIEWPSVSHYLTAYPFRAFNPAFYQSFSIAGQNGKIAAEELDAALQKYKIQHPQFFKMPAVAPETLKSVREMAITLKCDQHKSIAWILMLTRNACLRAFHRKEFAPPDETLMLVRLALLKKATA